VTQIHLERNISKTELDISNLVCRFVSGEPSGRTNNYPESGRKFLAVRSAILATAWLLVSPRRHIDDLRDNLLATSSVFDL